MATSIPTFQLKISEGMIDVNASADRLYGYCIEADKGPVMEPTFCASATEAKRIFGVDFLPHFYQNPTGIVICRVEFDNMAKGKVEFEAYPLNQAKTGADESGTKFKVLTVESTSEGPCKSRVVITKSSSGAGYNVSITINEVTSKTYQNVSTLEKIVNKINSRFGSFLHAELTDEYKAQVYNEDSSIKDKFLRDQFFVPEAEDRNSYGYLIGGSNGTMKTTKGESSDFSIDSMEGDFVEAKVLTNNVESFVGSTYYVQSDAKPDTDNLYQLYADKDGVTGTGMYVKISTPEEGSEASYNFLSYDDAEGLNNIGSGTVKTIGTGATDPNIETTRLAAYQKGFEKIQDVDLIGIATLVDSQAVQSALALHIEHVTEPEIHQLRFGITGYMGYVQEPEDGTALAIEDQATLEKIQGQASILDNEWMIFIGQGVLFEDEYGNRRVLKPCEATQLYTGIRSALGYSEAIFGGESKKVLKGVIDTLPVITDGSEITRELYEDLNESGVCTFKKEYGEVTFLEGVTTIQDRDVLSYENMMSIVAHVSKRLIRVAKPYQGRRLTEDLKSTLTTALLAELKDITETDGTLMELEDFNIPPYNVSVEAATKTMWDDRNNLIRVSKIIIKCRIVPVGALRDIDLGIIAI